MKRLTVFLLALVMCVAIGLGSWSTPAQADVTLNLKAVWAPNAEPDIAGYKIFGKTNSGGNWELWNGTAMNSNIVGTIETTTSGILLPLSPLQLLFPRTAPSTPEQGDFYFTMKAIDSNSNHSVPCINVLYHYNVDVTPPAAPTGLTITKQ